VVALRNLREIANLRDANQIVAEVLVHLVGMIEPGITTNELDREAVKIIKKRGGKAAFLGYHKYPKSTCISVDEEIVHGIPGRRKLKPGQIVSIDCGVRYKGYIGDAALTVPCGEVDDERWRLMEATNRALAQGVQAARAGNHLQDVSRAVQETAEGAGFSVIRSFVGHGIGTRMHEEPQIPNFVTGDRGPLLRDGMVLAIEPMVAAGTYDVKVLDDGWTAVTADGRPSAHFEHSVVVRDGEPEILSSTDAIVWGR
jgi:methionyl aminopeptidase